MGEQKELSSGPPQIPKFSGVLPSLDRYQGAMVFSAIGDALGWPTEFLKEKLGRKPPFALPLRDFVRWGKVVGGRWWGYHDEIARGEYSDDTQLTLAVARSISSSGDFEPEQFAYCELPLWLHYERGGGRSIKAAARSFIQRKTDWSRNFYKQGMLDYRQAGANGAAMRNLPIALASMQDEERLVRDSFFNAIITHGHPRAILGTILFGLAVRYMFMETNGKASGLLEYLREGMENAGRFVANDQRIHEWIEHWETYGRTARVSFKALFAESRDEASCYLSAVQEFLGRPAEEYYRFVGALTPETKGSGLGTVCAAIFLFLRNHERPSESIYTAVNLLGSDTDTIASFLGALLGARYGMDVVPRHLWEGIQDRDYLLKTASRLYKVGTGEPSEAITSGNAIDQREAHLMILAWEIGLHEMFWDTIGIGGTVVHPTLGRGKIISKDIRDIPREGYIAKLIRIKFDCGQTCVFHSRVEHNERVSESFAKDIERVLGL